MAPARTPPAPDGPTAEFARSLAARVSDRVDDTAATTGYVEFVGPLQLRGWAMHPASPDRSVDVAARLDGREIARGAADIARDDLTAAGFGDGRHGFVLNLDARLAPDEQARVVVEASDRAGHAQPLPRLEPTLLVAPSRIDEAHARRETADHAHWPVFVLGGARSGTSAVAQALLGLPRIAGHEEGHLLDIVTALTRVISSHYADRGEEWSERATMIATVPEAFFHDWRRHMFVDLARHLFPSGRWVDKTPRVSMITAAAELREIWPNARFVYLRRRGLENIRSRLMKFPSIAFEDHCLEWRRSLVEWQRVRPFLAGAAIEVDQIVLLREPERVGAEVASLLGLTAAEGTRLTASLRSERPERSSANTDRPVAIDQVDWTDGQRALFRRICGDTMLSFGYAETERYFLDGGAAQALRRW